MMKEPIENEQELPTLDNPHDPTTYVGIKVFFNLFFFAVIPATLIDFYV